MTDGELIARQAKQIEELRDEVAWLRAGIREARSIMVCIGGPLNDSRLSFTREQLQIFQRIDAALPVELAYRED